MNSILDIPTYTPMPQAEREALLADVEAYCREVRPLEDLCYLEHRYNEAVVSLGRKHDILGMTVPKQYGGRGADAATYAAAIVRIGREGTSVRTLFSGHCSIGQTPIVEWGTEEQKRRYLPATVTGECILAFGLTEPDAGSNPLEMQSTYRREGDHYVLNGVKYLISNATIAGAIIMFAYPEDPGAGKRRISAFIMDTDGDGIEREALIAKLGMPTSDTGMFELTEYRVPVENLLGAEGDGFAVAMQTLRSGRLSVAAGCVGVIEDCLDAAVDYAKERRQHGKAIARHQLVQDHIARIEVARQTSASIVGDAARWKAASDDRPGDAALATRVDQLIAEAKYAASNAAFDAADRALQVLGGRGWSDLYRPGRHLKDVRVCRIYEGTDEVLKLKIAAGVLGREYAAFR